MQAYKTKPNKDYQKAIKENPNTFRRSNGEYNIISNARPMHRLLVTNPFLWILFILRSLRFFQLTHSSASPCRRNYVVIGMHCSSRFFARTCMRVFRQTFSLLWNRVHIDHSSPAVLFVGICVEPHEAYLIWLHDTIVLALWIDWLCLSPRMRFHHKILSLSLQTWVIRSSYSIW